VRIEVGGETYAGTARVVSAHEEEDRLARELLVEKYATPGSPLTDWKKRSLPVVIAFPGHDASRATDEGAER
jgi:hypothetical protein